MTVFLVQHVDKPTREGNILDLVLTSEPNMVEEVSVQCPVSSSDHNVILFRLVCGVEHESNNINRYCY